MARRAFDAWMLEYFAWVRDGMGKDECGDGRVPEPEQDAKP
jgi:hypothetical protein